MTGLLFLADEANRSESATDKHYSHGKQICGIPKDLKKRLLTKSRFKVGSECLTKLYYLDNPEYGNRKKDDTFLKALAEGGFQVGELAKQYFPEGKEVEGLSYEKSESATRSLLVNDNVTIFEAAIRHSDLFVRIDILRKSQNTFELIEVKAKSFDKHKRNPFFTKNFTLRSDWEPYLLDVAFQTYVLRKSMPNIKVSSFLMLADKSAISTVDGLNQRFLIQRSNNAKTTISVKDGTSLETIGEPILCKVNVDDAVNYIMNEKYGSFSEWEKYVSTQSELVTSQSKHPPTLSAKCKQCEFRVDPDSSKAKSGFLECWQSAGVSQVNHNEPMVFDIWNFRRSDEMLSSGRIFMHELTEEDIAPNSTKAPGLSTSERQWIQVQKVKKSDPTPYVDADGLRDEMRSWKFPLHFIDFETTMTALPFSKGRRPYEQIAFQFSHHQVEADGSVAHKTQFLHRERGKFPNFDFAEHLMNALSKDSGTIFRYSHHENTVLCQIVDQFSANGELNEKHEEIVSWIKTVTTNSNGVDSWTGDRSMVDLCDLVKKYYYSPLMNGSNSIKQVLPAILSESEHLKKKYSKPIYGSSTGIPSLNFKNWTWLTKDIETGQVVDPYSLLPPLFSQTDGKIHDRIFNGSEIADGGSAMTAFAMMQFTEMSDSEAEKIQSCLLKYCELDTFAMVLVYEYWRYLVDTIPKNSSVA